MCIHAVRTTHILHIAILLGSAIDNIHKTRILSHPKNHNTNMQITRTPSLFLPVILAHSLTLKATNFMQKYTKMINKNINKIIKTLIIVTEKRTQTSTGKPLWKSVKMLKNTETSCWRPMQCTSKLLLSLWCITWQPSELSYYCWYNIKAHIDNDLSYIHQLNTIFPA